MYNKFIKIVFLLLCYLSLPSTLYALSVSPYTPFLNSLFVDSTNFAVYKVTKNNPSDIITVHAVPAASGLSIVCNTCNTSIEKECFVKLQLKALAVQSLHTKLTVNDQNGNEAKASIKTKIYDEPYTLNSLLIHVVRGEADLVKKVLDAAPWLAFRTGQVTDYSGRTFPNITAFQYALWAYDRHMWNLILKYLPTFIARQQLIDLERYGTPYGRHYDYYDLLDAFDRPQAQTDLTLNNTLGAAQRRVPVHVANEYVRKDRIFYPTPSFTEDTLPRYDFDNINGCYSWFPLTSNRGIGVDYFIGRGERSWAWGNEPENNRRTWYLKVDKAAMTQLFVIRSREYEILKDQFNFTHS